MAERDGRTNTSHMDFTSEGKFIDTFEVSDRAVFFTVQNETGIWKCMPHWQPPEKVVSDVIFDFQIINNEVFYLNTRGIFKVYQNEKTQVFEGTDIESFIIDGILIYKDNKNSLFDANNQKLISENVLAYSIYNYLVIFSTENGLFTYDINSALIEQIYEFENTLNQTEKNTITAIDICVDTIFLTIQSKHLIPEYVYNICVFNMSNKTVKPLVNIENSSKQFFENEEMGYMLEYPVGLIVQFDPGSYYSGYATFTNPNNGVCFQVMNYGYFYGHSENALLNGEKILSKYGVTGYYNLTQDGNEFKLSCSTENGFKFAAYGKAKFLEESKAIFLDMVKSLKKFEILSDEKKHEIAQTLMDDYKYHIDKIGEELALYGEEADKLEEELWPRSQNKLHSDYLGGNYLDHYFEAMYHQRMATDKLLGLRDIFSNSISGADVEFITNTHERAGSDGHSLVYSGYSQSGIHVILLSPFSTSSSFYYWHSANKIRGDERESGQALVNGMYDIFIEDLTNERDEFDVDFYDDWTDSAIHFPNMEEDKTVKELNRTWTNNGILKDRTWYMFSGMSGSDILMVDGEKIQLYNYYH
ncbi:MAG: hypothetical protein LBS21_04300 [Clostridiales bacterium]|jgi:hypothetical protein|nr:hypothetical protein [Clostridiales bacterium]